MNEWDLHVGSFAWDTTTTGRTASLWVNGAGVGRGTIGSTTISAAVGCPSIRVCSYPSHRPPLACLLSQGVFQALVPLPLRFGQALWPQKLRLGSASTSSLGRFLTCKQMRVTHVFRMHFFFFFLVCDAKPRSRLLRQLTPRRSQVVLVGNQSHGIEPPALGCLSIGSGSKGREKRLSKRIPGLVKTKSY